MHATCNHAFASFAKQNILPASQNPLNELIVLFPEQLPNSLPLHDSHIDHDAWWIRLWWYFLSNWCPLALRFHHFCHIRHLCLHRSCCCHEPLGAWVPQWVVVIWFQDGYASPFVSIVKTFVMMIGELDFMDTFHSEVPEEDVVYDGVSYAVFIIFLVFVSIIIMNLLVGRDSLTTYCAFRIA